MDLWVETLEHVQYNQTIREGLLNVTKIIIECNKTISCYGS
jgi:hypothetical protein